MKGTFFQKPFEFNINIDGESWRQGDEISGSLRIQNHGGQEVGSEGVSVILAHGHLNKVREKSSDAFELVEAIKHPAGDQFQWKFRTDINCPITDKSSSLFILYGRGQSLEKLGQLQLKILPFALIEDVVKVVQTNFRFVIKSQKHSRGEVEIKFAPPSSKAFAAVENLAIRFKMSGEDLEMHYIFNVKTVDPTAVGTTLIKDKKEFEQSFSKNQYRLPSGRFNYETIETAIGEVMAQIGKGPF